MQEDNEFGYNLPDEEARRNAYAQAEEDEAAVELAAGLGVLGRVPGHVQFRQDQGSVGGASVAASLGSAAVFQNRTRRTLVQIQQDEVVVRKEDRGVPGSKIYVSNRTAATRSLSIKFLGSFHLQSKNAAGENLQKSKNLQDEFVSNLEVMKMLKERIHQYDLLIPFMVPKVYRDIVGVDAWEGRWDTSNPNREIVDLTAHWGKLPLDHILKWQRDFNGYSDDIDHVSSVWVKDLLTSSMDPVLRRQVDDKYSDLDDYQKGGVSYFKIVVDTVFKMSSMAEESLKLFIKDFGKNGLAKVSNENVRTISFQVDGIAERLADSRLLRSESFVQYVTGYTHCSVTMFKNVFLNKLTEYTYLDATDGSYFSSMTSNQVLVKIRETSKAAVAIYDHLQLGKKWNLPGKQLLNAVYVNKCDNCGDPNHFSPKCPKPRDEEKCKKARELRVKTRGAAGGRGDQGRGGRGGRGDGSGRGSDSQGQRAPWDSTATGANPGSGVKMIEGAWKMHCTKGCGWNESHTSKYHDEQQRSAATFKVPPHHPYWAMSGKIHTAAVAGGVIIGSASVADAAQTSRSVTFGALMDVIDRHITSVESAEMGSFLGDLRNMMGN